MPDTHVDTIQQLRAFCISGQPYIIHWGPTHDNCDYCGLMDGLGLREFPKKLCISSMEEHAQHRIILLFKDQRCHAPIMTGKLLVLQRHHI